MGKNKGAADELARLIMEIGGGWIIGKIIGTVLVGVIILIIILISLC